MKHTVSLYIRQQGIKERILLQRDRTRTKQHNNGSISSYFVKVMFLSQKFALAVREKDSGEQEECSIPST